MMDKMKEKAGGSGREVCGARSLKGPKESGSGYEGAVGIEEPRRRRRRGFWGRGGVSEGSREGAEMNALIRTTTEERFGPLVRRSRRLLPQMKAHYCGA